MLPGFYALRWAGYKWPVYIQKSLTCKRNHFFLRYPNLYTILSTHLAWQNCSWFIGTGFLEEPWYIQTCVLMLPWHCSWNVSLTTTQGSCVDWRRVHFSLSIIRGWLLVLFYNSMRQHHSQFVLLRKFSAPGVSLIVSNYCWTCVSVSCMTSLKPRPLDTPSKSAAWPWRWPVLRGESCLRVYD